MSGEVHSTKGHNSYGLITLTSIGLILKQEQEQEQQQEQEQELEPEQEPEQEQEGSQ